MYYIPIKSLSLCRAKEIVIATRNKVNGRTSKVTATENKDKELLKQPAAELLTNQKKKLEHSFRVQ